MVGECFAPTAVEQRGLRRQRSALSGRLWEKLARVRKRPKDGDCGMPGSKRNPTAQGFPGSGKSSPVKLISTSQSAPPEVSRV